MSLVLKAIGAVALVPLALAAAVVTDFGLDDGRLVYALLGRNTIVEACLPELKKGLAARGFAPEDVEINPHPDIAVALGQPKSLAAEFTFEDGPAQTRIEGVMACVVGRNDVHVDFRTDATPVRTG